MSRVAVVLFNLGGPSSLEDIQPFLFNMFNDPAIISVSRPIRWLLAKLISKFRAPATRIIYKQIGGCSPLLSGTKEQARALEAVVAGPGLEILAFPAMRYWHPLIDEVAETVRQWRPDRVILLPLYPQFSDIMTGSSIKEWVHTAEDLMFVTTAICCWPTERGWIAALTELTKQGLNAARAIHTPHGSNQLLRVLFSAHSMPEAVIASGDPYQRHVKETVVAVVTALKEPSLDYQVCYQSRVGSQQQWIGPATIEAIRRAGAEGISIVLVPVTFVSEHSETLVELDIEYRYIAERAGVPAYIRVPTVRTHTYFVAGLARLVQKALSQEAGKLCCWSS